MTFPDAVAAFVDRRLPAAEVAAHLHVPNTRTLMAALAIRARCRPCQGLP